ncbi:DUF5065 family protein [Bacillus gaemokensis]|uniref:DUF5065 domain-containing protein n=1 Tax=Bacillus gaemokensis TaxID=574375 RepID=A0A073KBS4_9BACI|nr:DUF5065 family protein [Bacillus gaemokensis]KEK24734.1 hypothetical protein BAGA_24060 [Bacillus gaemokensis]KYG34556.1 hypothetical protein AZF08_09165 [Bacillus gaemokensis]
MEKLKSVALIGALTIGSFTTIGVFSTPNQALAATSSTVQKASPVVDDWRWQSFFLLHHNADYRAELAVGTLRHGDTFDVTSEVGGIDNGIIKIYRINYIGDGLDELQRFKTIQGGEAGHHFYSRFTTPITTVYTPGDYVAVLKVGDHYYYGGKFQITK